MDLGVSAMAFSPSYPKSQVAMQGKFTTKPINNFRYFRLGPTILSKITGMD